jgi:hypothetical protein
MGSRVAMHQARPQQRLLGRRGTVELTQEADRGMTWEALTVSS